MTTGTLVKVKAMAKVEGNKPEKIIEAWSIVSPASTRVITDRELAEIHAANLIARLFNEPDVWPSYWSSEWEEGSPPYRLDWEHDCLEWTDDPPDGHKFVMKPTESTTLLVRFGLVEMPS